MSMMKLPPRPKKDTRILVSIWHPEWGYHDIRETTVVGGDAKDVHAPVYAYMRRFARVDEGKTWIRSNSPLIADFRAKVADERAAVIERKKVEAIKQAEEEKQRQARQLSERDERIVDKLRKASELVKAAGVPEALVEVAFAAAIDELSSPRTLWPTGWR